MQIKNKASLEKNENFSFSESLKNFKPAFELFDSDDYADEEQALIQEFNIRAEKGNDLYSMSRNRELMLSVVLDAGLFIAAFDKNEILSGFSFSDGARKILGYDNSKDLPDEFSSWEKLLAPEERNSIVDHFWATVKNHKNLPETSPVKFHLVRKDGSVINVTGMVKILRRLDKSLEAYMFCFKEVTPDQEQAEQQLKALRSMSKVFYSMHLLDLKADTFTVYHAVNEVRMLANNTTGASQMMNQIISAVTADAYKKDTLFFTDLKTVSERMKDKSMISLEFRGNRVGWVLASFILVESDENGKPSKLMFTTRVIEKEKQREEKLIIESNTDPLTGLYNRHAYEFAINDLGVSGLDKDFVYVAIDINGLKVVNDTIGHEAGDELISGAADCLRHCFKPYGTIYRTGGDEFIAMIDADAPKLEEIKTNLAKTCDKWTGHKVEKLSLSCGYVRASENPKLSLHTMSVLADKRMYEAKNAFYRVQGVDRRGQQDAHKALCALYTKILKINITEDSYQIINMDEKEKSQTLGFSDKISKWFYNFGTSGSVYPDDVENFLKLTDLKFMSSYFLSDKTSLHIFYRRKYTEGFKQVMMEIIPANDYAHDNQTLFLYVKDIDR